ncbi:MAG: sel1 repeat family protein [Odoribacteraceae bacterium]|nr:sel1 repeat family protein [Odoribacteraceae bacterium]
MKTRTFITMLLSMSFLLPACNRAEGWFEKGVQEHKKGNLAESVKWMQKAADANYAKAQTQLAMMYMEGEGVEKDNARAIELFGKAARQGESLALLNLGLCHANGDGVQQNDSIALAYFREGLAGDGLSERNRSLAESMSRAVEERMSDFRTLNERELYHKGVEIAEKGNSTLAKEYFLISMDRGYALSGSMFALFCQAEHPELPVVFLKFYQKAAEQGESRAQIQLADYFLKNNNAKQAIYWLEKVTKSGNLDEEDQAAQEEILRSLDPSRLLPESAKKAYERGRELFVSGNHKEAVKLLAEAAEQGHAQAQVRLADCYKEGKGVPANARESVAWLKKAAELENVMAWLGLGTAYYLGNGVKMDKELALEWIEKAGHSGGLPDAVVPATELLVMKLKEEVKNAAKSNH